MFLVKAATRLGLRSMYNTYIHKSQEGLVLDGTILAGAAVVRGTKARSALVHFEP